MQPSSVALLLSSLSLLIAGMALGWQIVLYLLSAGRPRATLVQGLVADGGGAYVGPVGEYGRPVDTSVLRHQGIGGLEVVGVQVVNHGRLPVTIQAVSLQALGGSLAFTAIGRRIGPDLPHSLAPGTNASWYMHQADAQNLADVCRDVRRDQVKGIYGRAELATGKSVVTKTVVRL